MKNPLVSIIIPVFNGSNYLKEAIESALSQTYDNLEIIVVDDGSDDNGATASIALSFGDKIHYFYKSNGGVASALNYGINKMGGIFFSWLSHDDLYYPNKIERQMSLVNQFSDQSVFIYSDYETISSNGKHIAYHRINNEVSSNQFYALLFNQIHGCSTLISKDILLKVNGFDEKKQTTQDYDAWLEIAKLDVPFIHVPEILIKSRKHHEQDTYRKIDICNHEIKILNEKLINEIYNKRLNISKIFSYFLFKSNFHECNLLLKKIKEHQRYLHYVSYKLLYLFVKSKNKTAVLFKKLVNKVKKFF